MASNDSNTRINIYVNNDEAKRKLIELDEAFRKNEEALRRLKAAGEGDTESAIALRQAQAQLTTEMDKQRHAAGLNALSLTQVKAEYKSLLRQYNAAIPGSEHRERLAAQLQVVRARVRELEASAQSCGSRLAKIANSFNKYFTLLATFGAAITGLSMKFRQLAQDVAKMDDVYSDVMKTTGMTRDEVLALNEDLKKMDTRTSREALNLLARDAGKLNLTAKKDILDFVEAGNQIRVALGEDLGDDAIKNIGKLVDVFARSTKELEGMDLKGKMLAVGSAVNELGQSSTASEPYMVNFAQRLGGVAAQAGISIQNILGYASALDQSGQAVEMSATALSKFIMKLYEEPAEFAKLAGLEVSAFSKLLREDANAAVKQVLTSLSERGGFAQLVPVFQQLGLDGARAVGVLSSLATNIGKVTEAQEIANRAFIQGTSVTSEYSVKNNNLQARLEKAKKEFTEVSLALGERLNPILLKSTNGVTYLIRALVQLPEILKKYAGALVAATAGIIAYTVATRGAAMATGLLNSALVKSAKAFLTNPWTMAIAGLSLLAQVMYSVIARATEMSRAIKEATKEIETEQASANRLFDALSKTTKGSDEYFKILSVITEKYPDFLQGMTDEKGLLTDIEVARKKALDGIREETVLRKISDKQAEIENEKINKQVENYSDLGNNLRKQLKDNSFTDILLGDVRRMVKEGETLQSIYDHLMAQGVDANIRRGKIAVPAGNYLHKIIDAENTAKNKLEELSAAYLDTFGDIAAVQELLNPEGMMTLYLPSTSTPSNDAATPAKTSPPADTTDYKTELAALEKAQAERLLLLKEMHEQEFGQEEKHKLAIASLELVSLGNLLTLQERHGEDTTKTRLQIIDKTKEVNKQDYGIRLKNLDKHLAEWTVHEKEALEAGQLTEEEHQANAMRRELKHLEDKLALAAANGEETLSLEQQITDKRIAIARHGYEQLVKQQQEEQRKEVEALQKQLDSKEVSAEFFQQRLLAIELKGLQERLALARAAGKDTIRLEQEIEKKTAAGVKNLAAIRKKLLKSELEERRDMELQFLQDSHEAGLLSDEQHAQASLAVWAKYASDKASKVGEVATTVIQPIGNAVKAFEDNEVAENNLRRERELAAITEDYNSKMALAEGDAEEQQRIKEDFAAKKERIDYDAAKANLDTQKKYADANFAVQATQAAITGILSAMQAFSALASIPIVGPILGAAAAAAVGVTTALQIASLNKERQRIKSIALEATGGSPTSSSKIDPPKIPEQRTITPEEVDKSTIVRGYAGGKYDVVSEADGRQYSAPLVRSVTGVVQRPTLVAEEPELVVGIRDFRYLRRHINFPVVLEAIGDARRGRTVPAMAEGEYDSITNYESGIKNKAQPEGVPAGLLALVEKTQSTLGALNDTLRQIQRDGVHADVVATDVEAQLQRNERARKWAKNN